MRFLISIPVHEKPEVIYDQILNFQKYVKDCAIVLHVNIDYFESNNLQFLEKLENVWVNPTHLKVWWGNILFTHISNFNYMKTIIDFDYFVLHSSNDMYVKPGLEDYISNYDAGFVQHYVRRKYTRWWPSLECWGDPWLSEIQSESGQNRIVASQIEGSFYKREIMEKIVDIIDITSKNYSEEEKNRACAREEIFFSTIAESLVRSEKIGRPVVFSEVHRFDRRLWNTLDHREKIYNKYLKKIIPRTLFDRSNAKFNDKLFKSEFYKTTPEIVDKIRLGDGEYIEQNRYLDEGSGKFELYVGPQGLFAVKRVKRDYDDPVRTYIRNLEVKE